MRQVPHRQILYAGDLVYRDRVGETYAITYNPTHRWFYFPQLRSDEAILIKCFDSTEDGRGLPLTLRLMTQPAQQIHLHGKASSCGRWFFTLLN